jgi:hypothetical protein
MYGLKRPGNARFGRWEQNIMEQLGMTQKEESVSEVTFLPPTPKTKPVFHHPPIKKPTPAPAPENKRVEKLIEALSKRLALAEEATEELANRLSQTESLVQSLTETTKPSEDSSEESRSYWNQKKQFTPFCIDRTYATKNSKTTLDENHLVMTVDLPGGFKDDLIIYPFGYTIVPTTFPEMNLCLAFEGEQNGTVYGPLTLKDDLYIITVTTVYIDGLEVPLEELELPVTFTCDTILE